MDAAGRQGLAAAPLFRTLQTVLPGVALAGMVAVAAAAVAAFQGGPKLLYALVIGIALNYFSRGAKAKPGVDFAARQVLRLGVGLLGARITATQIVGLGWSTALVVVLAVATTILCGLGLGRRLGMTRAQGVLSGGAVAICGASAALAISAVLPRERDQDRFTVMVVVVVTILSTVAMVLYPLVAQLLHLVPAHAGLFIGGTIHDVAQVVGAGYTLGQPTGDLATIVKLFRVSMLALVVGIVSTAFKSARAAAAAEDAGDARSARRDALVPWFLWLFIAMVVVNSAGVIPGRVQLGLGELSGNCLLLAIAALGMKTSFGELLRVGWRPFLLLLVETCWMAALVLGIILATR